MALDMHDIGKAIFETSQQIQKCARELYSYAKAYAEAEKEYRTALAREIMRLLAEGNIGRGGA